MKNVPIEDAYRAAFDALVARIQQHLKKGASPADGPVRMYIAGGAALHLVTGERVTEDVDATFSRRVLIADEMAVSYRDPDGRARLLYLDRNYNDALGLLHEDAYADSRPVDVPGIDFRVLEVRVLSPLDLAVSKLARFGDQDRADIELLARRGLIDAASLRSRADEALRGYVGNIAPVQASIDIACRIVEALAPRTPAPPRATRGKR